MTKPGIKTTEFWMMVIILIFNGIIAYDVFPIGSIWEKLILIGIFAITGLGYGVARAITKKK